MNQTLRVMAATVPESLANGNKEASIGGTRYISFITQITINTNPA